jgi:hypothetical protein
MATTGLQAYWFTFPENPGFPHGFGVTAWSLADAKALLEASGYDFHKQASRVEIKEGVTVADLDAKHVAVNMGPIVVRGVWYPALNIGFGAPKHGTDAV